MRTTAAILTAGLLALGLATVAQAGERVVIQKQPPVYTEHGGARFIVLSPALPAIRYEVYTPPYYPPNTASINGARAVREQQAFDNNEHHSQAR